jgi:hypothetical protein
VQTRREAVILMTAIPLLSTDAVAQDAVAQPDRLDALFNHPAENLSVPSRVRQRYAILAYYIQLLNLQGPTRSRSEDIAAATKTYQLVGEALPGAMQDLREKCKHRSSRAYGRHSRNHRRNFGPSSDRLGSTQDCSLLVLLKNLSLQICCSMEQRPG